MRIVGLNKAEQEALSLIDESSYWTRLISAESSLVKQWLLHVYKDLPGTTRDKVQLARENEPFFIAKSYSAGRRRSSYSLLQEGCSLAVASVIKDFPNLLEGLQITVSSDNVKLKFSKTYPKTDPAPVIYGESMIKVLVRYIRRVNANAITHNVPIILSLASSVSTKDNTLVNPWSTSQSVDADQEIKISFMTPIPRIDRSDLTPKQVYTMLNKNSPWSLDTDIRDISHDKHIDFFEHLYSYNYKDVRDEQGLISSISVAEGISYIQCLEQIVRTIYRIKQDYV